MSPKHPPDGLRQQRGRPAVASPLSFKRPYPPGADRQRLLGRTIDLNQTTPRPCIARYRATADRGRS